MFKGFGHDIFVLGVAYHIGHGGECPDAPAYVGVDGPGRQAVVGTKVEYVPVFRDLCFDLFPVLGKFGLELAIVFEDDDVWQLLVDGMLDDHEVAELAAVSPFF